MNQDGRKSVWPGHATGVRSPQTCSRRFSAAAACHRRKLLVVTRPRERPSESAAKVIILRVHQDIGLAETEKVASPELEEAAIRDEIELNSCLCVALSPVVPIGPCLWMCRKAG